MARRPGSVAQLRARSTVAASSTHAANVAPSSAAIQRPKATWKTVTVTNGCTGSATITGLTSGAPYIVWLDAPNTPHKLDGSRDLYSGRSGIVNPL